jgi:hypothetical protein
MVSSRRARSSYYTVSTIRGRSPVGVRKVCRGFRTSRRTESLHHVCAERVLQANRVLHRQRLPFDLRTIPMSEPQYPQYCPIKAELARWGTQYNDLASRNGTYPLCSGVTFCCRP